MTTPQARRKVALLCGGPSSEYVVSLTSARCCAHALDRHQYQVRVFCVQEDGAWVCPEEEWDDTTPPSRVEKLFDLLDMPEFCPTGYFRQHPTVEGIRRLTSWAPDIVVPMMHGAFGEDGRLQGLLDFLSIPYIGSGVAASALGMDKRRSCNFLGSSGVRVPRHIILKSSSPSLQREDQLNGAGEMLGWPIVVKPSRGGSSIATTVANNLDELYRASNRAFDADSEVLLEQLITGTEVTCGVLDLAENFGGRIVCPPTEISLPKGEVFNFDSKYRPGATKEITPARLPEHVNMRIQAIAEKVHDLIGAVGLSRTDMIVTEDGHPVVLEINTLPGMTPTSLLPQGAAELGISMSTLLTGLVEGVFETLVTRQAREGSE
ncbi:MAG: D-alanine--D-alanine ligase [Candidatus Sumerlaeia bacterium]|nr:D-alanine--D-alanine ligase [Candidatus Sumerlaeia bacterium]